MSDFKVKMHQIRFRPPDPAGGAYSAPPDPLAGFEGLLLKGGRGRGGVEERRGSKEGERKGEGRTPGTCLHPPDMKS